jgi:AraC family transcriptional regulator
MAQPALSSPSISRVHPFTSLCVGPFLVQKFTRDGGEIEWRHPHHRIVLPLTDTDVRPMTVQFERGRTREFVWHSSFGFVPAGTQTRVVTSAATALQLLWAPDPETAGRLEPLVPFEHPFIQSSLHAIARELDRDVPDRLLVESIGSAILITLMRHFGGRGFEVPRAHGLSRERLRRIVDYVDSHLGEELTLDILAGIACLSPHHLSRSFHRATGLGLHRYVVQRRVDRAKRLVLESDLSMAEIAWTVGFGSQAAFTKHFHQKVGQSPARLRRAHLS